MRSTTSGAIRRPVAAKRWVMKTPKGAGAIGPSSIFLALRQKGSCSSLKMRCIMCRLLPR